MDSTPQPMPAEPPASLEPMLLAGTVIAGRFTLQALAGRGGMGAVYRATDSLSGQTVALKLLHSSSHADSARRFTREAELLSSLRHPGIVSYIAHGHTEQGQPFLAMEWLEGEDLSQRLARQPLQLEESMALLRQATQALAVAHQHGIIHRDLKPSNLFLRQGHPEQVVLVDFGLARHLIASQALTASQMVLGTPGYLAPEQASSNPRLTPSADIFSLGCVLYECLAGKPPFAAPHFVAALAKSLFAEPEPLRSLRPGVPDALEELVQRMLAKDPAHRPQEGSHLLAALEKVRARLGAKPDVSVPAGPPLSNLAEIEQHLVTVLLATARSIAGKAPGEQDSRQALRDSLRTLLASHGGRVELLADGALVLTLVASLGSATDPATLAARCALLIQERWPGADVVLTTGYGRLDQHLPMGEAMDRAGQLLDQGERLPGPDSARVLLDEVTAGLLGPGFRLSHSQPGLFQLLGESVGTDETRPLLGRPTPCVGREQELAVLGLAFNSCVQESAAQVVLVKAPAGVGKSRLRHEFLRRLKRQHPQALVLLARGDPMSPGSSGGLLGQALRQLCNISGGEPLEVRRERLARRLMQHLPPAQAQEGVAFLGELCGVPFFDEHHPRLRAARGDPRLMNTQVSRAWVAFLQAECAHHPVLLVFEDLHWGDVHSTRLMDEALRKLAEQPLMVLALARPEVEQLLPSLWAGRRQDVPLRELGRKAGARLVREVLGSEVPEPLIDRLVEQAGGNALFLEELIRRVGEGQEETAPKTVLAMLQARLGRLQAEERQVLLAASFFGRSFWLGGVRALLGARLPGPELKYWLQRLVELEWVEPQNSSRFPGEHEYRFRHALVRDAAYGLMPGSHKPEGHRLAGTWLEQSREHDLQVLAEHARLGHQPERAIRFYTRAAEQLFEHFDMPGMERCMELALALGAQGAERVQLRALQATSAFWKGDLAALFKIGSGVLAELRQGSLLWCWLASGLHLGHVLSGSQEQAIRIEQELLRAQPEEEARSAYLEALGITGCMGVWRGDRPESSAILERMMELGARAGPHMSLEQAWSFYSRSFFSFSFEARPWQACLWAEQGYRGLIEVGLERNATTVQTLWGMALEARGERAEAERQFRESLSLAQRLGQLPTILYAGMHLALSLAGSSEPTQQEEALALAGQWDVSHVHIFAGMDCTLRAKVAVSHGDLATAERQASKACALLEPYLFYQLTARTLLSQVLLRQGHASQARETAALGVQRLEQSGSGGAQAVGIRLALAEACLAQGDAPAGEAALRRALQCLHTRAQDILDTTARECFLHQVPENARTLELARQLLPEA